MWCTIFPLGFTEFLSSFPLYFASRHDLAVRWGGEEGEMILSEVAH